MHPLTLRTGLGSIAGNPISSEIELAQFLQRECGADGYRIEGGLLLALRWNADGTERIIERFQLEWANRA